jgi:transposase
MAAERISMRKIKDVLRLFYQAGLSRRQIAQSLSISRDSVAKTLSRAIAAGLSWPLPVELDDQKLEERLYPPVRPVKERRERTIPDWSHVHRELKCKFVTLTILWQEYKVQHPDGLQYSWFCDLYRQWAGRIDPVMRQHHVYGEKLFVDYCGSTIEVIDPTTGEERKAEVFVAVLGASNYTYAEATWTQRLPDWIGSHTRAFTFFGGVPSLVVPDNLKSGVKKAHRYEPDLNPTYDEMGRHYGTAIMPTRSRAPKDKAKVETGVLIVERWIMASLRNRRFFSLAELNEAIRLLLVRLNERPFKKLPGSRKSTFEELEKPCLMPLPSTSYVFARWKKARVNIDYHIEIEGHYYSVPHQYIKVKLDIRFTETTIECFHRGRRIASHARSLRKGQHTTVREHMPEKHRAYAEWTPERIIAWAAKIGESTAALIERLIASRAHPQQAYRSCLGILRLGKAYGEDRLEAACRRALLIGSVRYKSVESILKNGLDQKPLSGDEGQTAPALEHENIRGALYYHNLN